MVLAVSFKLVLLISRVFNVAQVGKPTSDPALFLILLSWQLVPGLGRNFTVVIVVLRSLMLFRLCGL